VRVEVPDGALPVGLLQVKLHKFTYCESDGDGHAHFNQVAEATTPYPGPRTYDETIKVPPPDVVLPVRRHKRRTTFRLVVPESVSRRKSARLEQPYRLPDQAPVVIQVGGGNDDDDDDGGGGGGGGGGGVGGQEAAAYASDYDQRSGRVRRQAPATGARKKLVKVLRDNEAEITVKFEPRDNADRIRAPIHDAEAGGTSSWWDVDVKEKSLDEILAHLNAVARDWRTRLGDVHANPEANFFATGEAPPVGEGEKPNPEGSRNVRLTLPPSLGIGLEYLSQFKMLGFYGLTTRGDARNVYTIPARLAVDSNDTSWIVGDTPPGYHYVTGTPVRSSSARKTISTKKVWQHPDSITGDSMLRSFNLYSNKKLVDPDRDDPIYRFRPRLVVHPSGYAYVADLSQYKPPAEKEGKLAMLTSLTSCIADIAGELLATKSGAYKIVGVQSGQPSVQATFDATQPGACFVMEIRFGSLDLAAKFGLAGLNFSWDARVAKTTDPIPIQPDRLLPQQQGEAAGANLTQGEYRILRAHLAHLAADGNESLPEFFIKDEATRFAAWRKDEDDRIAREAEEALERARESGAVGTQVGQQLEKAKELAENVGGRLGIGGGDGGGAAQNVPPVKTGGGGGGGAAQNVPPVETGGGGGGGAAAQGANVPAAEEGEGGRRGGENPNVPPADAPGPNPQAGEGEGGGGGNPAAAAPAEAGPEEGGGGGNPAAAAPAEAGPEEAGNVPPAGDGGGEEGEEEQEPPAEDDPLEGEEEEEEEEAAAAAAAAEDSEEEDPFVLPEAKAYETRPNPAPKPADRFVYFNRDVGNPAEKVCKGPPNYPAKFPKNFFLVVSEGERVDFFQGLGNVCLGGSFKNYGAELDEIPSKLGFKLRNWSQGIRFLDFYIFDSQTMVKYINESAKVGYARCVLSYDRLDE